MELNIGELLAAARQGIGMTQQQLARVTKLHQGVISEMESGKRVPTVEQLLRLAQTLKVPIQWFLTGSNTVGNEIRDISIQLHELFIVDLHVENEQVPGAFRADEDVIALAASGNSPSPRIIEALPAVLAWNSWRPGLLHEFAKVHDQRASNRLGWLADIALTIHGNQGFPGGCKSTSILEEYLRIVTKSQNDLEDSLGFAEEADKTPPVSRRWKIRYPASLDAFRTRAENLQRLRGRMLSRALSVP